MKKTILFLAAFAALVSCVKENPVTENPADETPSIETCSISLEASAPASSDAEDTKTTLIDGNLVHWTNGDAIKVLFFPIPSEYSTIYGASGILNSTFTGETAVSARFETDSWSWGASSSDKMDQGIALYPSSVTAVSNKASGSYGSMTRDIHYELPSVQTAVEGTFQSGINFAYAQIPSKEEFSNSTATLSFKNACALIKVTLPEGVDNVTSVEVVSANGSLAGTYEVSSYSSAAPNYPLVMTATTGSPSVTLSAPVGQTLKAGVPYYIVVWPGTHSDITFNFTNTEGLVATKSVGKEVTFVAAKYNSYKIKNDLSFEAAVGDYYFADGTTGDDPAGREVVGVVFYKGAPQSVDSGIPSKYSKGLAISLQDYDIEWSTTTIAASSLDASIKSGSSPANSTIGGYTAKTYWMTAYPALNAYTYTGYPALPESTSGWYHGAPVEWKLIVKDFAALNENLSSVSGAEAISSATSGYWIPFHNGARNMWVIYKNGEGVATKSLEWYNYSGQCKGVRPIFAF